jgi:hypothetical protein
MCHVLMRDVLCTADTPTHTGSTSLVPVFPSIYGGYAVSMGAEFFVSDFDPQPDVFTAKCAQMYVSGAQIGWFSLGGTQDKPPMGLFDTLMVPALLVTTSQRSTSHHHMTAFFTALAVVVWC